MLSVLPTHPTLPLSLSLSVLLVASSLSFTSKVLYNSDDSGRRPESVFAIRTQSRTVYTSCNRIICRIGTLSRCQGASATTKDVFLGLPEDPAHYHCCEEVVSFIFPLYPTHVKVKSDGRWDVEKGDLRICLSIYICLFNVVTLNDIQRKQSGLKYFQTQIRTCSTWGERGLSSLTPS